MISGGSIVTFDESIEVKRTSYSILPLLAAENVKVAKKKLALEIMYIAAMYNIAQEGKSRANLQDKEASVQQQWLQGME